MVVTKIADYTRLSQEETCIPVHPNNFVYRDKARNPSRQVRDMVGFEMKDDIKKQGFNDRILIVNSVLLGDTAKDGNSFTMRLIRYIASCNPVSLN